MKRLILFLFAFGAAFTVAQEPPPVIKKDVNYVNLSTVFFTKNKVDARIQPDMIRICERPGVAHKPPDAKSQCQEIARFDLSTFDSAKLPKDIRVILDKSGSMESYIPFERQIAEDLCKKFLIPRDFCSIWEFSELPTSIRLNNGKALGWTSNMEAMKEALGNLKTDKRMTSLFDPLYLDIEERLRTPHRIPGDASTKFTFMVTDGVQTISGFPIYDPETKKLCAQEKMVFGKTDGCIPVSAETIIEAHLHLNVPIYIIDFSEESFFVGEKLMNVGNSDRDLRNIAESTGGRSFRVKNAKDAMRAHQKIFEMISGTFILGFPLSPGEHTIDVQVGKRDKGKFVLNKHYQVQHQRYFHIQ